MQSQLSPTQPDNIADEQLIQPTSPEQMQEDSPGKKKSMLEKVKDKAKDKAKKFKSKVMKRPSEPDQHENEDEGSESGSNGTPHDNEEDNREAQDDSNEPPSLQNQALDKKDDHEGAYAKTISGLDGFATRDILKGTPKEAHADPLAPPPGTKPEVVSNIQESREAAETEPSFEDTYRNLEEVSAAPDETTPEATFKSDSTGPSGQGGDLPSEEQERGFEDGSEKTITQQIAPPTSDVVNRSLDRNPEKEDTSLAPQAGEKHFRDDILNRGLEEGKDEEDTSFGTRNKEEPFTEKKKTADTVTGGPTQELDTEAKPQTMTDGVYKGLGATKGGIAAAAATVAGAVGYGGASGKREEQKQELSDKDKATEEPKGKGYLDLAREKVGGLKDSITGGVQSRKEELARPPDAPSKQLPSEELDQKTDEPSSEASVTITERAAGTVKSFKDTVASKLGYGGAVTEGGQEVTSSSPEKVEETAGGQKPYTERFYETAAKVKDVTTSKLGYGGKKEGEILTSDEGSEEVRSDQKPYTQKLYEAAAGVKDVAASKLGYDFTSRKKSEKTDVSEHTQTKDEGKTGTAARFTPGEADKALSQMITDAVSTRAASVKDTLLSPFSSKSSNTGSPSGSSSTAAATKEVEAGEDATSNAPPSPDTGASGQSKGIIDRVTGAMSSILGKNPSSEKKEEQADVHPSSVQQT